MRCLLIPLLAVTGLFPCSASADGVTLVTPDGRTRPQPYQRWADRAHVPTPEARIVLTAHTAPCGADVFGCAAPGTIWISAPDPDTFLHELGHQFDYLAMTDVARLAFLRITHRAGGWRQERRSPHEQFAEAWRICARGWTPDQAFARGSVGDGYDPTAAEHRRACTLIRHAARAQVSGGS